MKIKSTTIYFPLNLHKEIKKIAEKENRSFNQQVISILKRSIEAHEPEKGGGK